MTNKTGAPHGEMLGLSKTLSNNSCNCMFNSPNLARAILYGAIEIGAVPDNNSIVKSISLTGGNPGISFGKMSGTYKQLGSAPPLGIVYPL